MEQIVLSATERLRDEARGPWRCVARVKSAKEIAVRDFILVVARAVQDSDRAFDPCQLIFDGKISVQHVLRIVEGVRICVQNLGHVKRMQWIERNDVTLEKARWIA